MNYTQAQIDRANAVSLEDFLHTQGETLIKSGREYRWKEHDSLTVRGNKWFRHSQSKGGYPIDFVKEFFIVRWSFYMTASKTQPYTKCFGKSNGFTCINVLLIQY